MSNATEDKVIESLHGNIFTKFSVPQEIVTNQGRSPIHFIANPKFGSST